MVLTFSIFCLSCGKVFHEIERRPCVGECGHLVCYDCIFSSDSTTCPICRLEFAFNDLKVDYQLEEFVVDLRTNAIGFDFQTLKTDLEKFDCGKCAICEKESEKLRFCLNCYNDLGVLEKDSSHKWILGSSESDDPELALARAKEVSVCSECALKLHNEHEMLPLRHIDNVSAVFESKYANVYSQLQEQQAVLDNGYGSWNETLQFIKSRIKRHEKRAALRARTCVHATFVVCIDARLQSLLNDSAHRIKELQEKSEKVFNCDLIYTMRVLEGSLKFAQRYGKNERELCELRDKMPEHKLSIEEIEQIDAALEERMRVLEANFKAKSKFPRIPEAPNYYKYRVIIEELQSYYSQYKVLSIQKNTIQEQLSTLIKECTASLKSRTSPVHQKLCDRKLTQKQLELDDTIMRLVRVSFQRNSALLMISKYFSPFQDGTCEDKVLRTMLTEFYDGLFPANILEEYL